MTDNSKTESQPVKADNSVSRILINSKLIAQTPFVNTNPFPQHYFIENKGQFETIQPDGQAPLVGRIMNKKYFICLPKTNIMKLVVISLLSFFIVSKAMAQNP